MPCGSARERVPVCSSVHRGSASGPRLYQHRRRAFRYAACAAAVSVTAMKHAVDSAGRRSNEHNVAEIAEQAAVARAAESQSISTKALPDSYETVGDITVKNPVMCARHVDVYYADNRAIKNVSLDVGRNEVIAMIGPSGCGKSTFLRCMNRMNDTIESARVTGEITLDGENIYGRDMDVVLLRARV